MTLLRRSTLLTDLILGQYMVMRKMGICSAKEEYSDDINKLVKLDMSKLNDMSYMSGKKLCRVVDMYDGDTLTVALPNAEMYRVRVYGCDTPELKGVTSEAGRKAKNEALSFIGASGARDLRNGKQMKDYFIWNTIIVEVEFIPEREKFGRMLGHIRKASGGITLTNHLIRTGNAVPYSGGTKD